MLNFRLPAFYDGLGGATERLASVVAGTANPA